METTINVGYKKDALRALNHYKAKDRGHVDVRLNNVKLCVVNKLLSRPVFRKNDLYVDATTLYEIMQPIGGRGSHHYHGLLPSEILTALQGIREPLAVIRSYEDKILLYSEIRKWDEEDMVCVVETHAALKRNYLASINKLVTMYPKDGLPELEGRKKKWEILYLSKRFRKD